MTSSVRIVANEEFLIKFHKPKDRVESEMFSKLLSNLAFEDPKTGEQIAEERARRGPKRERSQMAGKVAPIGGEQQAAEGGGADHDGYLQLLRDERSVHSFRKSQLLLINLIKI
jgi:hypothetical protein